MAIEFDKQSWQPGQPGLGDPRAPARPDWHGLQVRLLAAREAGRVLAAGGCDGARASPGSFDGLTARRIWGFGRESTFVNPKASANRKADEPNGTCVAGQPRRGERG